MSIKHRFAGNNPNSDLEAQFFEFHRNNPDVYLLFKKFADKVKKSGYKRYSCRTILHRVRWETDIKTVEGKNRTPFKINNNYSPYYARMLMAKHPHTYKNFFSLRTVTGDLE
jgi:hypothetical protein